MPHAPTNYGGFGLEGLQFPVHQRLSQCAPCATEDTVTPPASFIALPVLPDQAYANIESLLTDYRGVYSPDGGFYDAVNPTTGSVGHRRLVLDQSMIMAALDDALNDDALERYFASDPLSGAARLYLSYEQMSIGYGWTRSSSIMSRLRGARPVTRWTVSVTAAA